MRQLTFNFQVVLMYLIGRTVCPACNTIAKFRLNLIIYLVIILHRKTIIAKHNAMVTLTSRLPNESQLHNEVISKLVIIIDKHLQDNICVDTMGHNTII